MIRTLEAQKIDDLNRINAVVYMEAVNRREPDDLVIFDVNFYVLNLEYYEKIAMRPNGEFNEFDNPILVSTVVKYAKPFLKLIRSREAKYKQTTFYNYLGRYTPSQNDSIFMSEIERVNSQEWTGNELQKIYFWHLTKNDMEIVDKNQLEILLTPYEVAV